MESTGSKNRSAAILLTFFFLINLLVYGDTLSHPFMMEDERLFGLWARPFDLQSLLACINPFQKLLVYYRPTANFFYLLLNNLSSGNAFLCRFYILILYSIFTTLIYYLTNGIFKDKRRKDRI